MRVWIRCGVHVHGYVFGTKSWTRATHSNNPPAWQFRCWTPSHSKAQCSLCSSSSTLHIRTNTCMRRIMRTRTFTQRHSHQHARVSVHAGIHTQVYPRRTYPLQGPAHPSSSRTSSTTSEIPVDREHTSIWSKYFMKSDISIQNTPSSPPCQPGTGGEFRDGACTGAFRLVQSSLPVLACTDLVKVLHQVRQSSLPVHASTTPHWSDKSLLSLQCAHHAALSCDHSTATIKSDYAACKRERGSSVPSRLVGSQRSPGRDGTCELQRGSWTTCRSCHSSHPSTQRIPTDFGAEAAGGPQPSCTPPRCLLRENRCHRRVSASVMHRVDHQISSATLLICRILYPTTHSLSVAAISLGTPSEAARSMACSLG